MRKAYSLLTLYQERDRQAAELLDDIKTKRIRNEEDIIDSQENPESFSKREKEKLALQLKTYKKQEADALKKRKDAALALTEIMDIIKAPEKKRAKYIADYEKRKGNINNVKLPENQVVSALNPSRDGNASEVKTNVSEETNVLNIDQLNMPVQEDLSNSDSKKKDKNKRAIMTEAAGQLKKYNPQNDVMINPPVTDCHLSYDGIDKFTQRRKKETMPQNLFRHTEEFMKPTVKEKDYISCDVTASRIQGGFYYLNLTFTILSKEAQRSFGFLDKGTFFVFKLINGKIVTLTNTKTDIGTSDVNNGTTTYRAQLQMQNGEAKAFMDTELDVLRVAWSAGYEDYEIYDMDVLMNLFKCLDKENK